MLPAGVSLIHQPKIGLVEEIGRLQRMTRLFSPHLATREPAQFFVNKRYQLGECALIASTPSEKKLRRVAGRGCGPGFRHEKSAYSTIGKLGLAEREITNRKVGLDPAEFYSDSVGIAETEQIPARGR
jgi:hypothetical protein